MKQKKLNYRFHNPNSATDSADFLFKILIEANTGKVERAIKEAVLQEERVHKKYSPPSPEETKKNPLYPYE